MAMYEDCEFYIRPVCFAVSDHPGTHHSREMIFCGQLPEGHERLKPIIDTQGDLKTRAPRWFLEAVWDAAGMDYPPEV